MTTTAPAFDPHAPRVLIPGASLCLDDAADAIAYLAGKVRGNWQRAMDAGGEGVPTEPPTNDWQAIRV